MVTPEQAVETSTQEHIFGAQFNLIEVNAQSVELDLVEPMTLSFGTFPSRPSGWLTLTCEVDGKPTVGYGEGATLPQAVFTDDCGGNIADNMRELAHAISEAPGDTIKDALDVVETHRFTDGGHYPTARLATEMAILDASTKSCGQSVKELVGIPSEITEIPYGKSIGGATQDAIVRQAENALSNNARKVKIKVAPHLFGDVMGAIDHIRDEFPDIDMMVDANGGFDPTNVEHLAMLNDLDDQGLIMIEEPVSRVGRLQGLVAVRALRNAIPDMKTPICLDDCLRTREDCQLAVDEGLADIINIKPGRIGSFLKSLSLADFAASRGAEVMVGGMLEGTPGRCMTTLLGAYCLHRGFKVPGDLSLAQERLTSDLVPPDRQMVMINGNIKLPDGEGWGF